MIWMTEERLKRLADRIAEEVGRLFAKKADVHNGTLKIQKNGTTVKIFNANQEGDVTADITVPTRVSELENDEGYAKTESPTLTGSPRAPTPAGADNSTRIATTAYVKTLIANLVNGAPETLDTLKEIADALGENDDAVQALNAAIGKKVDKVSGKGLSTNDFTTAEKDKLAGILDRATANAPSQTVPKANGSASAGTEAGYSRGDHVHPLQTSVSGNAGTADRWKTARKINGLSVQGDADRADYGTCPTAAATAAKTVSCAGFALVTGAAITVRFTVTNTAADPTLNVNNTGAKPVSYRGKAIAAGYLAAGRTYEFRYNGTQWELVGDLDTNNTYSNMKGATASAAGAAGLAPAPPAGAQEKYLRGDGTYQTPPNTVTRVKGNAESAYRTGDVNLTPANIGAVSKSGDAMTGTLASSKTTNTYLAGNKGDAIINSTAGAGAYTMLAKLNSTNGYFTDGVYQGRRELHYTAKPTVDANTNSVTKNATLLDEAGNSSFPGIMAAAYFKAAISGKGNSFPRGDGTWVEMIEATDADIDSIINGTFK